MGATELKDFIHDGEELIEIKMQKQDRLVIHAGIPPSMSPKLRRTSKSKIGPFEGYDEMNKTERHKPTKRTPEGTELSPFYCLAIRTKSVKRPWSYSALPFGLREMSQLHQKFALAKVDDFPRGMMRYPLCEMRLNVFSSFENMIGDACTKIRWHFGYLLCSSTVEL
jgi:hypothetical protein